MGLLTALVARHIHFPVIVFLAKSTLALSKIIIIIIIIQNNINYEIIIRNLYSAIMPLGGYRGAGGTGR